MDPNFLLGLAVGLSTQLKWEWNLVADYIIYAKNLAANLKHIQPYLVL